MTGQYIQKAKKAVGTGRGERSGVDRCPGRGKAECSAVEK
jgi:hypothetical protein